MPTKVIIDCDPGTDDAIALMLAVASPELEIAGITTVAGMTTSTQAASNACKILSLINAPAIPVAIGAAQPLSRPLRFDHSYCGTDGLAEISLPEAGHKPEKGSADQKYQSLFIRENLSPTVLSIGPMTNLATFLQSGGQIPRVVTASGNYGVFRDPTRVNPRSSWNLRTDPEAAELVFQSVPHIIAVGLDISLQLSNEMVDRLLRNADPDLPQTRFFKKAIDFNRQKGLDPARLLVDSLAIAQVICPELSRRTAGHVKIDTKSELLPGNTVFTGKNIGKATVCNAEVAYEFDFDRFLTLLSERVFHQRRI